MKTVPCGRSSVHSLLEKGLLFSPWRLNTTPLLPNGVSHLKFSEVLKVLLPKPRSMWVLDPGSSSRLTIRDPFWIGSKRTFVTDRTCSVGKVRRDGATTRDSLDTNISFVTLRFSLSHPNLKRTLFPFPSPSLLPLSTLDRRDPLTEGNCPSLLLPSSSLCGLRSDSDYRWVIGTPVDLAGVKPGKDIKLMVEGFPVRYFWT